MKRVSEKQREKNKQKAQETNELHKLFREVWDEQEDEEGYCYCFESGRALHGTTYRSNTCCYHHVLEKNEKAHPQYKMVKKNIIIVHPDVHTNITSNLEKCPKVKEYREHLLLLHQNDELKD